MLPLYFHVLLHVTQEITCQPHKNNYMCFMQKYLMSSLTMNLEILKQAGVALFEYNCKRVNEKLCPFCWLTVVEIDLICQNLN